MVRWSTLSNQNMSLPMPASYSIVKSKQADEFPIYRGTTTAANIYHSAQVSLEQTYNSHDKQQDHTDSLEALGYDHDSETRHASSPPIALKPIQHTSSQQENDKQAVVKAPRNYKCSYPVTAAGSTTSSSSSTNSTEKMVAGTSSIQHHSASSKSYGGSGTGNSHGYGSEPNSPSPTNGRSSVELLERNIERWEQQRTTRRSVNPAPSSSLQGAVKKPQKISDIRTAYSRSTPQNAPLSAPPADTKKKQLDKVAYDKEAEVNALTNLLVTKMNIQLEPNSYGICTKCFKSVRFEDEGCTALDQLYHTRCFSCNKCGRNLKGVVFYAVDGQAFCEADYMDTLEKCASCKKPITERILRATGKPFHPKCFTCIACKQCMDGIPFTVDASNQIHCIKDFHWKFAPRCSICQDPIVPEAGQEETVRIVCMDRNFHPKCYRCEDCGLGLSSDEEGHGCYPLDGHILCIRCNNKRVQALN